VTDADGERIASYNYEAFGTIKDATGALGNPITYTGRWLEPETGDYFYRARYYDSNVGMFLKRDPIGFGSEDYNFYRYVGNGSIKYNDPLGYGILSRLFPQRFWGGEIGVGLIGIGETKVTCCDEKRNHRQMLFYKECYGLTLGISVSFGVTQGMNGEYCKPKYYEGWFLEGGLSSSIAGLGQDIGFNCDDKYDFSYSGVNEWYWSLGFSFPIKFAACQYTYIRDEKK
jgi:RHS repeat-associated protein